MLVISEHVIDRYVEAQQWAIENGLHKEFSEAMSQLRNYGCSEEDPTRCRVILGYDWAPHSFSFVIEGKKDGEYRHWFNGGLIYQGPDSPADGGFPSLTVSLHNNIGWFMHT